MRKAQNIFHITLIAAMVILLGRFFISSVQWERWGTAAGRILGERIYEVLSPGTLYLDDIEHQMAGSVEEHLLSQFSPIKQYFMDQTPALVIRQYTAMEEGNPQENQIQAGQVIHYEAVSQEIQSPSSGKIQGNIQEAVSRNVMTGNVYSKSSLSDYKFLMSNFYTVTSVTSLGEDKLRAAEFLDKDLSLPKDGKGPQILIFHTHSQEAFADSVDGDVSTTIVGVGEYLAELLHGKYGYEVLHDTSVYDLVNGKLDRSKAYTYAENNIAKILEEYPSIEVVIDLHRDGVNEDMRLVTEIDGKPTAKIMFFNGISYSNMNGDIAYLRNPNRDDNLAMSLQMQLLGNGYYPGLLRRIYINAYRYCLHLRGRSMLIEAGAQNNTVEEVKNAMEPLADILDKLLSGQKAY